MTAACRTRQHARNLAAIERDLADADALIARWAASCVPTLHATQAANINTLPTAPYVFVQAHNTTGTVLACDYCPRGIDPGDTFYHCADADVVCCAPCSYSSRLP